MTGSMWTQLFSNLQHPDQLVAWAGYAGMAAIVFSETGLLAGFFLPGDSLLVTAGLIASQGALDIWILNAFLIPAAILGDSTGYLIGYVAGPAIFRRQESIFFRREYLERTHRFFEKHGGKTIILARFVPIVRTFAPTVAGVGRMTYRKFLFYNVIGGILWVAGMTLIGYTLGRTVPNIDKHVHWVVGIVVFLSFVPIFMEVLRKKKNLS